VITSFVQNHVALESLLHLHKVMWLLSAYFIWVKSCDSWVLTSFG